MCCVPTQLADISTDVVGAEEYAGWINRTIGTITRVDEATGSRAWVPDSELLETVRAETRTPLKAFAKDAAHWSAFFSGELSRPKPRARRRSRAPAPAPAAPSVPAPAEAVAPAAADLEIVLEIVVPTIAPAVTEVHAPSPAPADGFFSPGGTWHPSRPPPAPPAPAPAPAPESPPPAPAEDPWPPPPMEVAAPAPAEEPLWVEDEGAEEELDAASCSSESMDDSPGDELFGKGHRAGGLLCAASSSYSRTLLRSASRIRAQTPPGHLMRAAGLTTSETHPNYVAPNDPTMGLPLPRSPTAASTAGSSRRLASDSQAFELQPLSAPEQAAAAAAAAGAASPWNDLFPASPYYHPRPATSPAGAGRGLRSACSSSSMHGASAWEGQLFTPSTLPVTVAMRIAASSATKEEGGLSPPARLPTRIGSSSQPRLLPPQMHGRSTSLDSLGPGQLGQPSSPSARSTSIGVDGGLRHQPSIGPSACGTVTRELQRSSSAIAPKLLDFSLGLPRPLSGARGKTHRQSSFGGSAFAPAGKSSCSPSLLPLHRQRVMQAAAHHQQLPSRPSTSRGAFSRSQSVVLLPSSPHAKRGLGSRSGSTAALVQRRPQTSSGRDVLTRWALRYNVALQGYMGQPFDVMTQDS